MHSPAQRTHECALFDEPGSFCFDIEEIGKFDCGDGAADSDVLTNRL